MFNTFKKRYNRWKRWASWNLNGNGYKILVLFGIVKSPTFDMQPAIETFTNDLWSGEFRNSN